MRMLTGLHFLLSYACTYECDHCFVYSSPRAGGTFTIDQIRKVLQEAEKIGTVKTIFFEGGEPFLFYALMLEAAKQAKDMGLDFGIVTNGYFAVSEEDAKLWLAPLRDLGISNLTISDDVLHSGDIIESAAKRASAAASELGIQTSTIAVEEPSVIEPEQAKGEKGEPIVGGSVMFRGRAVEKMVQGLPLKSWDAFNECPHEKLDAPSRVHIDRYGNVQLCQGISMGNMWEVPLSTIVTNYDARQHPILKSIEEGGPARLVKDYDIEHEEEYVDACHLCYRARTCLLDKFPKYLAPPQVYGR